MAINSDHGPDPIGNLALCVNELQLSIVIGDLLNVYILSMLIYSYDTI